MTKYLIAGIVSFFCVPAMAQEYVAPLMESVATHQRATQAEKKPSLLSLPFFEDFANNGIYPKSERWQDHYVYINNTMAYAPISEGAATFDALDEKGIPYEPNHAQTLVSADSLTTQAIDLSTYQASDSLYLSFFYQAKGNGFAPKSADSFMLFFLQDNGIWRNVWKIHGDTSSQWHQVMLPVIDTLFFHEGFKMRWVNKATMGIGNSHWHLDYIHLDAHRSSADTSLADLAMIAAQSSILADFTAMPYRHFRTDPNTFLAQNLTATARNNSNQVANTNAQHIATLSTNGSVLSTNGTSVIANAYSTEQVAFPGYNLPTLDASAQFIIENKYFLSNVGFDQHPENDTLLQVQTFGNYFAYDDGSAEQSYFLNLQSNAPGRTAVEFALYTPDTLRGMAIQLARQVPDASYKEFYLSVYQSIAINGAQDQLIYQEEFLFPRYADTANAFVTYAFETPQVLPAGSFYLVLTQPAGGVSDSLYMALDVNRTNGNHRYYDIGSGWTPSLIAGALLWRPLVGAPLPPSSVSEEVPVLDARLYPNPAEEQLNFLATSPLSALAQYELYDLSGRRLQTGALRTATSINISTLPGGTFLFVALDKGKRYVQKFVKQ